MRKFIVTAALGFVLTLPSFASAGTPSWCGSGPTTQCADAEFDFASALQARFGNAWNSGGAWADDPACPSGLNDGPNAFCMAYFHYHGTYRFVEGSVSRSQDANTTASLTHVTTWRRRWRRCDVRLPNGSPGNIAGTLKSNEPCDALPLEATYAVGQEMYYAGRVGYIHEVFWQFAESGSFAAAGMNRIAFARCGYKHGTITCSDATGDSFRYTY